MFILRKEKNRNLAYISSKQVILCFGIKPITFLSTSWQKTPFGKMNFYIYFFRRCSCKNSCFSELANNSTPCAKLMIHSLNFKKDVVILKILPSILRFWFSSYYPIHVVISLPLWIKLTMDQLLLFFLCNFSSFF